MAKVHKFAPALLCSVFLVACNSDPIEDIENTNQYSWQRYMNATEFEQLQEGMTYMEVVEIVRGAEQKKEDGKYIWHDERLMTTAYAITFGQDKLKTKEKIMIQGHSKRDLAEEEKERAKP